MAPAPKVRTIAARVALGAWFGAMLLLGASLLAKHAVALPAPSERPLLAQAIGTPRSSEARPGWMSVHVLYTECRCSRRIVDNGTTLRFSFPAREMRPVDSAFPARAAS
jgi:hypothetical protein